MVDDHQDNTDRHFQGQQKTEKVYCFSRRHPIVLLRIVLITTIVGVGAIMGMVTLLSLGSINESLWQKAAFLGLIFLFTVIHHVLFLRLMNYYLDIVIITSYRVIDMQKSIFVQDDKEIIDLHEIQDIKKKQEGIWKNLLNYGNLIVTIATGGDPMHLQDLPNPEYYFHKINSAKRNYILDRRTQKFGSAHSQEALPSSESMQTLAREQVPLTDS